MNETITTSEIFVEACIMGRHRTTQGETARVPLDKVLAARGDCAADCVRPFLESIPCVDAEWTNRNGEVVHQTAAERQRQVRKWIDDASKRERQRADLVAEMSYAQGEITNARAANDADAEAKAVKHRADASLALDRMKTTETGERICPLGLGFCGVAETADGTPLYLLDIDLDADALTGWGTQREASNMLFGDTHVCATWDSRRGEGCHGLAVCEAHPTALAKARAHILAKYPADEKALGAHHAFIALPSLDKGACTIFTATDAEKAEYDARARARADAVRTKAVADADDDEKWLIRFCDGKTSDLAGIHLDHAHWLAECTICGGKLRAHNGMHLDRQFAELIWAATAGAKQGYGTDKRGETLAATLRQIHWGAEHSYYERQPKRKGRKSDAVPVSVPSGGTPRSPSRSPLPTTSRAGATSAIAAESAGHKASEGEATARAEGAPKRKKATARDVAGAWYDGFSYDTFTCELLSPQGERVTLDDAAAALCRAHPDVSLTQAMDAGKVWVRNNPARQFDGLRRRVEELANSYTPADAGAIDRYAMRCQFDAYETRRLHLWLYQICGRAMIRGEKTDGMIVLAGAAEGTRKTTFFDAISRALCGRDAPKVTALGKDKDLDILLTQAPVVVIDEIDRILTKTDVAELKMRITQPGSTVRAPYDRDAKYRENAAVFGATTNDTKPIPAGEGEARRYWVIHPTRTIAFESTAEVTQLVREAAHNTLAELRAHADDYDRLTTTGKIWVESLEDERETARRNGDLKVDDAPSLAICAAIDAIARRAPVYWETVFPLATVYTAIETGDGRAIGIDGLLWAPPKSQASAISRLIRARKIRNTHRINGCVKKGLTFADLATEFSPGTSPRIDAHFD